jgi:two-component system NtrC family sensor kinase
MTLPYLLRPQTYSQMSLRYKLPLAFGFAIVITALIISAVLSWYTYRQMRDDLFASAEGISKTLARGLAPLMLRDEVWQAFESIVTPLTTVATENPGYKLVIVLDKEQRIFVSSRPKALPMRRRLIDLDREYEPVLARMKPDETITWYEETGTLAGHIFVATPILAEDGMPLGSVIVRFADSLFLDRFNEARRRVALATTATISLLLPLGWLFSKRLSDPLVLLRKRMESLHGQARSSSEEATRRPLSDEIRELATQFDKMKAELARNEILKTQMASADRLAAIGRLAAGVAHEINNPLGGMINAVNTFERYGDNKELGAKTISLLKRGLAQIQHTVGAMLVEARLESRAFTPEDIDDLKTLTNAEQSGRSVHVVWDNNIRVPVALPATPLRQLILNLMLNAVAAAEENGHVGCRIHFDGGLLSITVRNTGPVIPSQRLLKMFEPYEVENSAGNGLGLWICYQIVTQLKGSINVKSEEGETSFSIELPVECEALAMGTA